MVEDLLRKRSLPEFESVLTLLRSRGNLESWAKNFASPLVIDSDEHDNRMNKCLDGDGSPICIRNALGPWAVKDKCSNFTLFQELGDTVVRVNDRAPARHADIIPENGGLQQSLTCKLSSYLEYLTGHMPATLDGYLTEGKSQYAPFYLNGWTVFADNPELYKLFVIPDFFATIDDTTALLQSVNETLFKTTPQESVQWSEAIDRKLAKLFIGPPGTTTRLHYDAGDAHGWLGQLKGRKLFFLFPPNNSKGLKPLSSEKETVQSALDPLTLDLSALKDDNLEPMAIVLEPGDAILIPRRWWHYAVALDCSVTFQKNFYNASTNAQGLVQMVMKTLQAIGKK
eukprot:jgi/Picsp_1/2810/NSC_01036-R1_protein